MGMGLSLEQPWPPQPCLCRQLFAAWVPCWVLPRAAPSLGTQALALGTRSEWPQQPPLQWKKKPRSFVGRSCLKFGPSLPHGYRGAQAEAGPCASGERAGGSARGLVSAVLVPQGKLAGSRESMGVTPEFVPTRVHQPWVAGLSQTCPPSPF